MIVSPDSGTSYSVVIAPPGTDRIFLHNPGANNTFRARDLDFAKIARADFFHFGDTFRADCRRDQRFGDVMHPRRRGISVSVTLSLLPRWQIDGSVTLPRPAADRFTASVTDSPLLGSPETFG